MSDSEPNPKPNLIPNPNRNAIIAAPFPWKEDVHVQIMRRYFAKMRGNRRTTPLVAPPPLDVFLSGLGAFLGLSLIGFLALSYHLPLLFAPLGASAVLIYGAPDAPLSQPRNLLLGHTLSASIGVLTYFFFGFTWWSAALGTSLAILLMMLTKTTHPPGGATALFAIMSKAQFIYILTPVLTGVFLLLIIALLINNLSPNRSYPRYWL
ncbi:MAG: HPP family protein [Desulfitobacteriaceae bacterium]|nr:HPP family protein [Desulfitobacteriaceae bacterium]MDI6879707.1 HPP family protein [Desulfitobacteriaceae bacterium]MDI6915152.1 HPP family protein [Desulfitobacteriaceae bacterium]